MTDYINRDALMNELEREVELADDWKTAHEIANVVKYFPVAGVEERKTGRWLWQDGVRCSNCNHKLLTTGLPSYCPNCGSKIEE